METRAGEKNTHSSQVDRKDPALSPSEPGTQPRRERRPPRLSAPPRHSFSLDPFSPATDESGDDKKREPSITERHSKQEKAGAATATPPVGGKTKTVLNIPGASSPIKVTLSPQPRSSGGHTPPILSLLTPPVSPGRPRSSLRISHSLSLDRIPARHDRTPTVRQDPQQSTILNILRGTPTLTLTISPRLRTEDEHPAIPDPVLPSRFSPRTAGKTLADTAQIHEVKGKEDDAEDGKQQGIQIILPGSQDEWKIEVQAATPPRATPGLSASDPTQPPSLEQLTEAARRLAESIPAGEETRYRELLKDIAYHLFLMALVSPNAMNAFCEPSGVKPADISLEWWNSLSTKTQFLSILNALFSMGVNVFVQRDYIPQALKELRESFGKCFNSPTDFLGNSLTLVSSSAAAFAFAAMSYEAFKWVGDVASILPGAASLATSFTTRYPSVKKGTHKIRLALNKDMRVQRQMADKLRHLKLNYANSLRTLIRTEGFKLNNKDLARLLDSLGNEVEGIPLGEVLSPKTPFERLKEYSLLALEASFSTVISTAAFITFTQKGFDGTNAIAHLRGGDLDYLSRLEKFGIGVTGGGVSMMLYWLAALNFIPTATFVASELFWGAVHAGRQLIRHPIETLQETVESPQRFYRYCKLSLGTVAVWRAGGAMITVGNGVVRNKKGIFHPLFEYFPGYRKIFADLNGYGGIAINLTAVINQILKKEKEQKKKSPELEDFLRQLDETPLPPMMEVKMGDDNATATLPTLSHLRQYSIYKAEPVDLRGRSVEMAQGRDAREVDDEDADELNLEALPLLANPGQEAPDLDDHKAPASCMERARQWLGFR